MKKHKTVAAYISSFPEWENKLQLLRTSILKNSDVTETLKWNMPVYTVGGKNIIGIGAFKSHIGLWFFQGALLKDKATVLVNAQEGKTQAMRHWRFTASDTISTTLVQTYINEAVQYQKEGKTVLIEKKTTTIELPKELKGAFDTNSKLKGVFDTLSTYKQRAYIEYIATAKRVTTKESRLEKIIPMIMEGKGLNDKYKK